MKCRASRRISSGCSREGETVMGKGADAGMVSAEAARASRWKCATGLRATIADWAVAGEERPVQS